MVNPSKLETKVIDKLMMQGYDIDEIMSMNYSKIDKIIKQEDDIY